tara:strand:- start:1592 stop:1759 length:168 start_codon:yes stop_codon:yes gene_type:complete
MTAFIIFILISIILVLIGKVHQNSIESKNQKKLIKNLKRFEDLWVNKYTNDEQER